MTIKNIPRCCKCPLKAKPSLGKGKYSTPVLQKFTFRLLRTLGASIPHRGLYSRRAVVISGAALTKHRKRRLKTAGMYSLTVVEAASLKSRCFKARLPLPSSPLLASGGGQQPWASLACRHITPRSASVTLRSAPLCLFSSCKDPSHIGLRPLLCQYELIVTTYICNNLISKKRSESRSVVSDSLRPHGLYGIIQARILEWVSFPFSRGSSQPRD